MLERLANMPDVFIAIISGRSVNNVREMVGIEGIDMVRWEVEPMGEALDGLMGEATDLFMHFSM